MKPDFLIIRHGQSEGNVNKNVYFETPDHLVPLTKKGIAQADECGENISEIIKQGDYTGNIYAWQSPYLRCRQTADRALAQLSDFEYALKRREDPRLREQEFGSSPPTEDLREKHEQERKWYGHFFYRFPQGESGADVYDRCSHFLETVFRDYPEEKKYIDEYYPTQRICLIFSHGLTARVLAMRILHATYEEFEGWKNPKNCQIIHLRWNEYKGYHLSSEYGFERWK